MSGLCSKHREFSLECSICAMSLPQMLEDIGRVSQERWLADCEEIARLRVAVELLSQVAVEAIRLVHGQQLGDHHSHEPCSECGLGGEGAIRDALAKAFGPGYTKLVWGNDMNVDSDVLQLAVAATSIAEMNRRLEGK